MRVFGRHQMGSAERHCLNCRPKEKSCHLASGPGQYQEPVLNARRTLNARRKYLEAAFFQNSLSISILYSHNALWSMFLWRLRSIRFQKNGFPWACSGIFSKHIAPKSPAREANRRDQPEKPPQRKTSHSVKSFKTLQQAAKLCRRQDGSKLQISCNVGNQLQRRSSAVGGPYHPRAGSFRLRGMLMAACGRKRRITYSANRSQRHRRRNI